MFHDLLKPASILSKVLQCDELSIIDAIECILQTTWEMEQLRAANFENLPTVNKVLSRLCHNEGITYQLIQYEQGTCIAYMYLKSHKNGFADYIAACLKERVKLNNPEVLNDAVILLFTQGWQRSQGVEFADTALRSAIAHFTVSFRCIPCEGRMEGLTLLRRIILPYGGSCSILHTVRGRIFGRADFLFTYVKWTC